MFPYCGEVNVFGSQRDQGGAAPGAYLTFTTGAYCSLVKDADATQGPEA